MSKLDRVPAAYKQNMVQMMNLGFEFEASLSELKKQNNDLEKAINGILMESSRIN
jgi:hypothetical protein